MLPNNKRIERIYELLHTMNSNQIEAVEHIVTQLTKPYTTITSAPSSDIIDECLLYMFGDALKIHHCFSKEPLSKDRFEYALERAAQLCGKSAMLAPKGNPGHDITINGEKISLKTEAAAKIKTERVHISKFMELGKGAWDFTLLLERFFEHMKAYDRIFTLRCISKSPSNLHYVLVEIPKTLLEEARFGTLREDINSNQNPKPGYCDVFDHHNELKFQLYFDGGTERKLQVRNLSMKHCILHATWMFSGTG